MTVRSAPGGVKRWLEERHPDWLRLIRLLRYEADLLRVRVAAALSPTQRRHRRELRGERGLLIQLGSGPHPFPGWLNLDGTPSADLRVDLREPMPLQDGSARLIYSEHFLDHVQYPHGVRQLLRDCHRVLEKGETMRVVVHDAELLLRAYVDRDEEFFESLRKAGSNATSLPVEYVNFIFRFDVFHQFIYDYAALETQFVEAGFSEVRRSSFRGSAIPELNVDLDLPDRAIQSLYVEADK